MTSAALHEPFHDLARQREADRLGMLVFLASEVMLFGGLFAAALGLRLAHPVEYIAASQHTHLWLGTANTAVLLSSSLLVALAVGAAKAGRARRLTALLLGAALLGVAFALKVIVKGTPSAPPVATPMITPPKLILLPLTPISPDPIP